MLDPGSADAHVGLHNYMCERYVFYGPSHAQARLSVEVSAGPRSENRRRWRPFQMLVSFNQGVVFYYSLVST